MIAAVSLAIGALLAWTQTSHWRRTIIFLLLIWESASLILTTYDDLILGIIRRWEDLAVASELEEIVASSDGIVLAGEHMGMITLQDRPLYLQPFEVTQLAHAQLWDQTPLVESIEEKEFDRILIYHHPEFPLHEERWTPEMLDAIQTNYRLSRLLADTRVYAPRNSEATMQATSNACDGAPWQLPSSSLVGVITHEDSIDFLGRGNENSIPVFAVADGLLFRLPGWDNQVAILHDDPLRSGEQIWSVYGDMAGSMSSQSYVASEFPPGSNGIPVAAGDLLGYQGVWSGQERQRTWVHVNFSILEATRGDQFPGEQESHLALPYGPYLGIANSGQDNIRALRCLEDSS